jgi:hypothetical protein
LDVSRLDTGATLAVFLLLLWLPLGVTFFTRDTSESAVSTTEQRSLEALPELELSRESLSALPGALERYYDDHLGLRDPLIRAWAWLHMRGLGVSSSDKLIVGRDGWLFFGHENAVAQYRGVARFDDEALDRWARVLEQRTRWLAARDIDYLLVLVPNKHRQYGQYMPASLPRASDVSQLDQLVERLSRDGRVPFLDLRDALDAAARKARVYHKTDTHWNDLGAYAAYRAILERLHAIDPRLAPLPPVAVRPYTRTRPGMGLARIVGLSRALPEESFELAVVEPRAEVHPKRRAVLEDRMRRQLPFGLGTGDDRLPKAVVFRDSFSDALVPLLSESFSRVVWVWERDVDPRVVEAERPDVVIQEIAERFLDRPPRGIAAFEKLGPDRD